MTMSRWRLSCIFVSTDAGALRQSGHRIRTVQELPGHASVETKMLSIHVPDQAGPGLPSPLDAD
jgi:hypothetical protein